MSAQGAMKHALRVPERMLMNVYPVRQDTTILRQKHARLPARLDFIQLITYAILVQVSV